ncbi:hypothetical protein KC352_g72 [Hortaea werneckii]|nr:hypothetical protein KC352_g72 [Hortaea werneckii]
MGLGGYMKAWQRQTKDFGHTDSDKYSCLVFDNRGMGNSDKPLLRYTTSEMAKDIVELLDHVGWKDQRSVHVVGISMGGMIAQELGLLIPDRICSLNLISTAPRIVRTLPYLENLRNRINLMVPKSIDAQIAKTRRHRICQRAFPNERRPLCSWRTLEAPKSRYLSQLGDLVGRERIMVLHGTGDHMIDFVHAQMLLKELGGEEVGVTKSFHEGIGHVAPFEIRNEFKRIIAERA